MSRANNTLEKILQIDIMKFVKNNRKLLIYAVIIILAVIAFFKFYEIEEKITYITEKVKRQNIQKVVNATGGVRAIELVTIGAQASGKIEKLYVIVGQKVKKGNLIAEIDSTTQQNEVNINKSKLTSYEAQLAAAKISLKQACRYAHYRF
ncbi:MAG: biotin/lipoyl-binding protein [Coxiellaceae bacterium]|nr:biotin/lipoyl-binding protein [Coxiellaceae bacterium]